MRWDFYVLCAEDRPRPALQLPLAYRFHELPGLCDASRASGSLKFRLLHLYLCAICLLITESSAGCTESKRQWLDPLFFYCFTVTGLEVSTSEYSELARFYDIGRRAEYGVFILYATKLWRQFETDASCDSVPTPRFMDSSSRAVYLAMSDDATNKLLLPNPGFCTDDYVNESDMDDDDDSSDWEDYFQDGGKSSVDDKFFHRVVSKASLVSRPSLITLMVAQNERQMALSNQASHSASAILRTRASPSAALEISPNDSDENSLMMKGRRPCNLKPLQPQAPHRGASVQRPAIVAPANHNHVQAALSARVTRHNMLSTELTESLRHHLLWERQQKTSTANAVLKRHHTSLDVANLKQIPETLCMKHSEDANASSWHTYFIKNAFDGYHSKGW